MNPKYREIPFEAWHIELLFKGGVSAGLSFEYDALVMKFLEKGNSRTLLADDMPVLCGGTLEQWKGRHIAWAFLNANTGKSMTTVTRRARRIIGEAKGRVECTVRKDFPAGQRWARMLGFWIETPTLKQYGPDGADHIGYVRINP